MSMESPLRAVAVCVGLPALTVLGGLWAAWGRTRRHDPAPAEITTWRSVLVGGALLAALALAWPLGLGLPQVPAASASDWLPVAGLLGGVVALAACLRGVPARAIEWASIVAGMAMIPVMFRRLLEGEGRTGVLLWCAGGIAAMLACRWALRRAGEERGALPGFLVWAALACAAGTVLLTGNIAPAIMFGGLSAAAAPLMVVGLLRPAGRFGPGLGAIAIPAATLWAYTGVLSDTPPVCNALSAASVLLAGAGGVVVPARWKVWPRILTRTALAAIPALIALGVAITNQPPGTFE